jgi:hypothetical protein
VDVRQRRDFRCLLICVQEQDIGLHLRRVTSIPVPLGYCPGTLNRNVGAWVIIVMVGAPIIRVPALSPPLLHLFLITGEFSMAGVRDNITCRQCGEAGLVELGGFG